jgi:phospholipid/cholesterol/gamma-HCH transport system substrate-binding protein
MPAKATRVVRVFVIVLFAVAASGFLYLLINNFQFTRGLSIRIHFTSVGDLNTGAWVRKAGIKVGSVTKLAPAEDEKTIIVTLTLKPGQIVRSTDKFALVSKGILGDMYIEQNPGPKDSPLAAESQLFEGQPAFNITDLLGGDTMTMVTDLAGSIKGIVDLLKKHQDEIEATLKDVARTAQNVRIVTDRAVVLTDSVPEIARQITSSMNTLESAVTNVSVTTKNMLARLDNNLTTSAEDLAASMKSIRAGTADIQAAVTALTAQNSVIARLSAPATGQSLDATVKNLEAISQGLLKVTKETQKIVEGVSDIFETK